MINTAQFNNNQERENSNTNEIKHFNLSQSDRVKITSTTFFSKKKKNNERSPQSNQTDDFIN